MCVFASASSFCRASALVHSTTLAGLLIFLRDRISAILLLLESVVRVFEAVITPYLLMPFYYTPALYVLTSLSAPSHTSLSQSILSSFFITAGEDPDETRVLVMYKAGSTHSFFSAITGLYNSLQFFSTQK